MMDAVTCPRNKRWLKGMLRVLPLELARKLQPYAECLTEDEKRELGLTSKKE